MALIAYVAVGAVMAVAVREARRSPDAVETTVAVIAGALWLPLAALTVWGLIGGRRARS